jgi:hypothetical protein
MTTSRPLTGLGGGGGGRGSGTKFDLLNGFLASGLGIGSSNLSPDETAS